MKTFVKHISSKSVNIGTYEFRGIDKPLNTHMEVLD